MPGGFNVPCSTFSNQTGSTRMKVSGKCAARVSTLPIPRSWPGLLWTAPCETICRTKLITDPETQRILGVGIVGRGAEALIAEGALAVEMGAVVQDLVLTMHPHPTLSETLEEAAAILCGDTTYVLSRNDSSIRPPPAPRSALPEQRTVPGAPP